MISLGIEEFVKSPPPWLKGQRLGLLCNQASVDRHLRHSRDLIDQALPGQLRCLFSPQHGFFAEKQDNMIESGHGRDAQGRPVFSLYGETRRPDQTMFDHLDVLVVDIVDVGTRVYTFMSTLAYCLEEAARTGKKVVVLDRPNPIGGAALEGNILRDDCRSFVGIERLPMRHGLTFAELALFLNAKLPTPAELTVIPMAGWRRGVHFRQPDCRGSFPLRTCPPTPRPWSIPARYSGRGPISRKGGVRPCPSSCLGAPFLKHDAMLDALRTTPLPGCILRPVCFEPTSNKWSGEVCIGFQIHVTEPLVFMPYRTSLAVLGAIMTLYPEQFKLKEPPYEYEFEREPLDLILGDGSIRGELRQDRPVLDLEAGWRSELAAFAEERRPYLLY